VDDGDLRLENEELRAARRRLVAAADAERRRIEGELHDGVQQDLVALAVNLQLARRLAADEPTALTPLLEEIGRDVQAALDDVRRLAARVYPALLLDRGLAEALRSAASEARIPTRVDAPRPVERFPAEIETVAYFCCVEALEIAASDPQPGRRATVRLGREPNALLLDLAVEGGEPWTELALLGIGDRLAAVGGRLAAPSGAAPGSRLSATIPLAP
jgi:signal transduction histidine kinase